MTNGFVREKSMERGFSPDFRDPEDLLLDKLLHLFGFLELSSFEPLAYPLDQMMRRLHAQIRFEEKTLQFVQDLLIDRLFSQKELVDLFDKTLVGL